MSYPITAPEPSSDNGYYRDHAALLCSSFTRWTGRQLININTHSDNELSRALYQAPFVLLSHGIQHDPIFTYGNRTAQHLFAVNWSELVNMPSRCSAEPAAQDERERLLARVQQFGFVDDYSGVRIARTGQRFFVSQAIVWNLIDDHDARVGQAAYFDRWLPLEKATVSVDRFKI